MNILTTTAAWKGYKKPFWSSSIKSRFIGLAILCSDDEWVRALLPRVTKRYQTYGLYDFSGVLTPDVYASDVKANDRAVEFRGHFRGKKLGPFRLPIPGAHNVSNALAAISVALELDVSVDLIRTGLAAFSGVERRFHIRGEKAGIMVVDDYGHHPTEIRATLAASKSAWDRRVVAIFQPHRYTRTRDLVDEFAKAFEQADVVYVTDIYSAGEMELPGISGELVVEKMRSSGHSSVHWANGDLDLIQQVKNDLRPGDVVITLGAGDIWKVGKDLLASLA